MNTNPDFVIENGTLITYKGHEHTVIVPNGVIAIGKYAFQYCGAPRSIQLPHGLTDIAQGAFYRCDSLRHIFLPDTLTRIEKEAFSGCECLTEIIIPQHVAYLGEKVFFGCRQLKRVTITNSVSKIGENIFGECNQLHDLIISKDTIHRAGTYAIRKHFISSSLMHKYLEESLTFSCADFEKLLISTILLKNNKQHLIEHYLTADHPAPIAKLYSLVKRVSIDDLDKWLALAEHKKATSCLAFLLREKGQRFTAEEIEQNEEIKTEKALGIRERTLTEWRKIFRISIKDGRASITDYKGKENVVMIPARVGQYPVKSVDGSPFLSCPEHLSVIISEGIQSIHRIFYYCSHLENVTLPKTLECIEDNTFSHCTHLKTLYIPEGLRSFCWGSINACENLTEISLPNSTRELSGTIWGCDSLISISVREDHTRFRTIDGNLYSKDGTILHRYAQGKLEHRFEIPAHVTHISPYAFFGSDRLTEIAIPNGVIEIGKGAFRMCKHLLCIHIPDSVTNIDNDAFTHHTPTISLPLSRSTRRTVHRTSPSSSGKLTICAPSGSYAENYAKEHGILFVAENAP